MISDVWIDLVNLGVDLFRYIYIYSGKLKTLFTFQIKKNYSSKIYSMNSPFWYVQIPN